MGGWPWPNGRRQRRLPGSGLEEEDFLGDNLDRVAFDALPVGPLGVVESALHLDQVALLLVLGARGAEAVESGDAVEFGEGFGVGGVVLDRRASGPLGGGGGGRIFSPWLPVASEPKTVTLIARRSPSP